MIQARAIYIGRRMLNGGKVGHGLILEDQVRALSDFLRIERAASFFSFKSNAPNIVGGTYNVECETDGTRIQTVRTLTFAGQEAWNSAGSWQAEDKATMARRDAAARQRKLASDTALQRDIGALRYHYKNLSGASKRAFLLMLWDELEK